jgi:hypothetical protein
LFKETSECSFTPQPTVMLVPFVDSCIDLKKVEKMVMDGKKYS